MLLIYPPLAKPCEPPAGIARLSGALSSHAIRHNLLDANLEGILYLLETGAALPEDRADRWTTRAQRHLAENLGAVRHRALYRSMDRYRRAVMDLNRVLEQAGKASGAILSLSNSQHRELSPARSDDLLRMAVHPELDPFHPYFSERLVAVVEQEQPKIIGFSLTYLSQALTTFAMIGFLRQRYPGLLIVCGGGLVTSWLSRPGWRNPFSGLVDHFIGGPGEAALLKLAGVDGTPRCHAAGYGALPLGDYLAPGIILPYSGSSGCFWNKCTFCPEQAEKNAYVPVGAGRAAGEMAELSGRMQPSLIHLLDNAISPALMNALIDNPPGAPWYGFVRIGRELTDPDFCRKLKRSGCVMLKLGIESGDQDVLDRLHKGVHLETASRVLAMLRQAGIATYVYLLFGTPAETIESARTTLDFTAAHADAIGFLNLAIFNMPVGSSEAQRLRTRRFYEGDLSLYTDFEHPAGWDRRQVRKFLDQEFRRHPAISAILSNDPPFFTSNHAPFFVME